MATKVSSAVVTVPAQKLPLCCPTPESSRWNLHPRVFLPLSAKRPQVSCPYCGTRYALASQAAANKESGE